MAVMTTTRTGRPGDRAARATRATRAIEGACAMLLAASAAVHLELFASGYQHIPVIGDLFLVQAALAIALAVGLILTERTVVRAGALLLAVGTIVGYAASRVVVLFGFHEQPSLAGLVAGALEVGAAIAAGTLLVRAMPGRGRRQQSSRSAQGREPSVAGGRRVPGAAAALALLSAALLAVVLLASSGGTAAARPPAPRAAVAAPARGVVVARVTISGYAFHPARIVVSPGETVVVTNDDTVTHRLSAVPGSRPFGGFDTGYVPPGATMRFRAPRSPGRYRYYCSLHQFMTGVLVVSG